MPRSGPGGQGAGPGGRRRRRLRAVSAAILLVLAGVVVALSLITRNIIQGQERLLLRERTGEAAAALGSAFSGSESSLRLLGALARMDKGRGGLFNEAARSVTTPGAQTWLVTSQRGKGSTVTAAMGSARPSVRPCLATRSGWHAGPWRPPGWCRA